MADSDRSPSDWGAAYRKQWQLYDAFTGRIRGLLSELLLADDVTAVQVDARTKEVDSFVDKIARRPGRISRNSIGSWVRQMIGASRPCMP